MKKEKDRIITNISSKLDHEAAGVLRKIHSLHFWEILQKKYEQGRYQGYCEAIEEVENQL